MAKKRSANAEAREPLPPEGFAAPAAANPDTGGLAPDDDKLFVKAIKKAGDKLKEKRRQLEQAKINLRNAKAECQEAEVALEKLANEELPLFKSARKKKAKAAPAMASVVSTEETKPLPFTAPSDDAPKARRGRTKKQEATVE